MLVLHSALFVCALMMQMHLSFTCITRICVLNCMFAILNLMVIDHRQWIMGHTRPDPSRLLRKCLGLKYDRRESVIRMKVQSEFDRTQCVVTLSD